MEMAVEMRNFSAKRNPHGLSPAEAAAEWDGVFDSNTPTKKQLGNLAQKHSEGGEKILAEEYGGVLGLAAILKVDPKRGIKQRNRATRQLVFGRNERFEEPPPSFLELCREGLEDATLIMLIVAATFSLVLGLTTSEHPEEGWYEGVAIYVTVILVDFTAAGVDWKKNQAYYALKAKSKDKGANALRDGVQYSAQAKVDSGHRVSTLDLVVGDILILGVGDIFPADGVVIESNGLECDEAALTGESDKVKKDPINAPFVLAGTGVSRGTGKMMVIAVGSESAAGRIADAVAGKKEYVKMPCKAALAQNFTRLIITPERSDFDLRQYLKHEHDGSLEPLMLRMCDRDVRIAHIEHLKGPDNEWEVRVVETWPLETVKNVELFAVKKGDAAAESVLKVKLEVMAGQIGYGGLVAAALTTLVLLVRWAVEDMWMLGRPFFTYTHYTNCTTNLYPDKTWNEMISAGCISYAAKPEEPCDGCVNETAVPTVYSFIANYTSLELEPIRGAVVIADDWKSLLQMFVYGVTVLVVAVPEGLPLAVTMALVISSMRMQTDPTNCYVRHLNACETMGNATAICSDKTGTLTTNQMVVSKTYLGGKVRDHGGHNHRGITGRELGEEAWNETMLALCLNTMDKTNILEVQKKNKQGGTKTALEYLGNTTECALLLFARRSGFKDTALRVVDNNPYQWPVGARLFPYSSEVKRMTIVVKHDGGFRVITKGASEIVLKMCTTAVGPGGDAVPLDAKRPGLGGEQGNTLRREILDTHIGAFADAALRTIGFAVKDLPAGTSAAQLHAMTEAEVTANMTLMGIFGIGDPVRDEVPRCIAQCARAGVTVRMCTGDNLRTACAISKNCGLLDSSAGYATIRTIEFESACAGGDGNKTDKTDVIVSPSGEMLGCEGKYFRHLVYDDVTQAIKKQELDKYWPKLRLVARCSPTDKYVLVKGMRESMLFQSPRYVERPDPRVGTYAQVVAVTGDGTNDAPALATADVGFAMGIQGTEIAKDACDIILMDDNFKSIVEAVKWGRNVYDSIAKFLQFQLTVNVVAVIFEFASAAIIKTAPLKAIQLLWVNLIMDTLAALALASEHPTDALLDRKPYGKTAALITPSMWRYILGGALYQLVVLTLITVYAPMIIRCDASLDPGGCDADGMIISQIGSGHGGKAHAHFTLVFHTFVLMQVFNEINARFLGDEWWVWKGFWSNSIFVAIFFGTLAVQWFMVDIAGKVTEAVPLTPEQHLWCFGLGFGALIWGVLCRVLIKPEACKCSRHWSNAKVAAIEAGEWEAEDDPSVITSSFLGAVGGGGALPVGQQGHGADHVHPARQ